MPGNIYTPWFYLCGEVLMISPLYLIFIAFPSCTYYNLSRNNLVEAQMKSRAISYILDFLSVVCNIKFNFGYLYLCASKTEYILN